MMVARRISSFVADSVRWSRDVELWSVVAMLLGGSRGQGMFDQSYDPELKLLAIVRDSFCDLLYLVLTARNC